ncbi:MAG: hypothetical protein RL660_423 [Bacteroidota bacterium]
MAQYTIAQALREMLRDSNWRQRYLQSRIKLDYEQIMGITVAKYTQEVKLVDNKLVIRTNVGPLKQELTNMRDTIRERFNEHLQETIIKEVIII